MPSGWVGVLCPVFECQLPEIFLLLSFTVNVNCCCATVWPQLLVITTTIIPSSVELMLMIRNLKQRPGVKQTKKLNPQKMNRGWEKSQGNPIKNPTLQLARQKKQQQEIKRQCQEICIGSTLKYMVAKTATRPSTTLPAVSKSYHMPASQQAYNHAWHVTYEG